MRLVVTTFGSEHTAGRLYVQWLEQRPDADVPRLLRSVRVDAIAERGGAPQVLQVVGGTCAVIQSEDDHEDPARATYWTLRAGVPGQIRLREVPMRSRGDAPTPHDPTAREVEGDSAAAVAACNLPAARALTRGER